MTSDFIDRVEALARASHDGQFRKGPLALPYVTHCEEVAQLVREHGGDHIAIAAAWLHDVVEDTARTLGDIEAGFGPDVASVVAEVTDSPNLTKTEARAAQISEAPHKSPRAALVKVADQTSNMRSIVATPPYWGRAQALRYIEKARAVVAGLNAPASLKSEFRNAADAAAAKAKRFPLNHKNSTCMTE